MHTDRSRQRADPYVITALIVAAMLRLVRLDEARLWFDEVMSARWVALPWREMVHAALTDMHPPLYFTLLKGWVSWAGTTDWALRLPSAVASCVAVGVTAALAGQLAGARAARWAAWLAALSPYLLHYGQEARMYAFVSALAALLALLWARYARGTTERLGAGFALCATALVATHYYGVFYVSALAASAVLFAWWRQRPAAGVWGAGPALVAAAVALACAALLARRQAGGAYELGLAAVPGALWSLLGGPELLPSSAAVHTHGVRAALPYMPLAALGLAALAVLAVAGFTRLSASARLLVGSGLAGALAAPFAAQLAAAVDVNPRYLAPAVPLLIALLAAGVPARLDRGWRSAAAVVLLGLLALGSGWHLSRPGHGREDIVDIERWLAAHLDPHEPLLVTSFEMAILAAHHWPEREVHLYPEMRIVATPENAAALAAALPFPPERPRAVYVFGRVWLSDPDGALRKELRARYASCGELREADVEILCLRDRTPRTVPVNARALLRTSRAPRQRRSPPDEAHRATAASPPRLSPRSAPRSGRGSAGPRPGRPEEAAG